MKFSELAIYFDKLEKTSSRLEITAILKELFTKTSSNEIDKVVYLSLGILAPSYESILLNLAERMMLKVVSIANDSDIVEVNKLYKKYGDLGDVAQELSQLTISNFQFSVEDVYKKLLEVAKVSGDGSVDQKINLMADLLKNLDPLSARFVARIPVGKLRLGFSEKTILDALEIDETFYNIRPDIGYIALKAKSGELKTITPKIGVPVVPMLAARLNSTTEMVEKMEEVSVEPKFDGLRIFIHFDRKKELIKIFTRNMNAIDINTFPELLEVGKFIKADRVILDTEAVGLDPKRQMFVDFQKTVSRRRKHEIEKNSTEIPLQFQVFDILLCDNESQINKNYIERRKLLEKVVVNGKLLRVDENVVTKDPEKIKELHQKYLKMGLEGVVVKKANAGYVSGRTGWNWVKMKEEEGQKGRLPDTLDCIVMGYFSGKGKRAQFGLGKILVGIKDGDRVLTLTKIGTGLTEEMLVYIKNELNKLKSGDIPKGYVAQKDLIPDNWAIPKMVVEVSADSISKSTKHSLGLSLRFPRFIKIREDKGINEATTLSELKGIYTMQKM